MAQLKTFVLMFVLLSTTTFCFAESVFPHETGDGVPVEIKHSASNNSNDRDISVNVYINGHYLIVSFLQNIGEVVIEISNEYGAVVNYEMTDTPTGYQYYIPATGNYVVTFTLQNGDEYYGEFEITD